MLPLLSRKQAAAYILETYGISRNSRTLAQLACNGAGPAFRRIGRNCYYTQQALDDYLGSITSEPMISSRPSREDELMFAD
jgi:hypothetical protein